LRRAEIYIEKTLVGYLTEDEYKTKYSFTYIDGYSGQPVSMTMPVEKPEYVFGKFPPFFEGLLPEGMLLEGLLKKRKIDRDDLFSQLMCVGNDMVGNVTVKEIVNE
jgi:serine/threonine-protein kinase HipA